MKVICFFFHLFFSDYFSSPPPPYIFDVTVLPVILSFIQSHSRFLLNPLSLFLSCFSYSLLLSFFFYHCLCPVLFNYFSHRSLQTFLFHSFEILFSCDNSSLFLFPLLILYSIVLKHAAILIERFCKPCVTKEQNEMLILMNHPFARPLLHRALRCTNRP